MRILRAAKYPHVPAVCGYPDTTTRLIVPYSRSRRRYAVGPRARPLPNRPQPAHARHLQHAVAVLVQRDAFRAMQLTPRSSTYAARATARTSNQCLCVTFRCRGLCDCVTAQRNTEVTRHERRVVSRGHQRSGLTSSCAALSVRKAAAPLARCRESAGIRFTAQPHLDRISRMCPDRARA